MKFPRRGLVLAVMSLAGTLDTQARETTLDLSAGYRTDELRWSIASDLSGRQTPNVLSELAWENVRVYQLAAGWQLETADRVQLRANAAYGSIVRGDNRDSDYTGDDRTREWSRSENETNGDDIYDIAFALGVRLPVARPSLNVTPLVGYAFQGQNLRITDGRQTVSRPDLAPPLFMPAPLGPIIGLDSTYRTRWHGPWVGVELANAFRPSVTGRLRVEYHFADLYAKANWNLRTEEGTGFQHPISFEHEAEGRGIAASAGLAARIKDGPWSATLSLDYRDWETDPGIDTVHLASGARQVTRLNAVDWTSRSVSLGLSRRF